MSSQNEYEYPFEREHELLRELVVELMSERMCISCPICGKQISKSKNGTDSESVCPKCGSELNYTVNGVTVNIEVVKVSIKQMKTA